MQTLLFTLTPWVSADSFVWKLYRDANTKRKVQNPLATATTANIHRRWYDFYLFEISQHPIFRDLLWYVIPMGECELASLCCVKCSAISSLSDPPHSTGQFRAVISKKKMSDDLAAVHELIVVRRILDCKCLRNPQAWVFIWLFTTTVVFLSHK